MSRINSITSHNNNYNTIIILINSSNINSCVPLRCHRTIRTITCGCRSVNSNSNININSSSKITIDTINSSSNRSKCITCMRTIISRPLPVNSHFNSRPIPRPTPPPRAMTSLVTNRRATVNAYSRHTSYYSSRVDRYGLSNSNNN